MSALALSACSGNTGNQVGDGVTGPRLESLDTGPDGLIAAANRQPLPAIVRRGVEILESINLAIRDRDRRR